MPGITVEIGDRVGRAYRVRLKLSNDEYRENYRRTSASYFNPERKVNAVCWHGHRKFMHKVFNRNMDARIQTAIADYKGYADFAENYRETGRKKIGAPIAGGYPRMCDACNCAESGLDV